MAGYKSQITNALKGEYKRGMASVVDQLASLGYKAIQYAFQQGAMKQRYHKGAVRQGNKWFYRTYNLYESFASAVYVNGVLQEGSMRFLTNKKSKEPYEGKTGHQWAEDYLRAQHPRNNVAVLCVAAMPYTEYLEEGRHRGGYEIQVISAAQDYLEEHKNSINWGIFGGYKLARVIGGDTTYGRV